MHTSFRRLAVWIGAGASTLFLLAAALQPAAAATELRGVVTMRYYYNDAEDGPQTGVIKLRYNDPTREDAGYDFFNEDYTTVTDGAMYVAADSGKVKFFGNNIGQGGVYQMRRFADAMPNKSSGLYNRFGVEVKNRGVYAIYDEANDLYIKVRVTSLTKKRVTVPRPPELTAPAVTSPREGAFIADGSDIVYYSWTSVPGAVNYHFQLDYFDATTDAWVNSFDYDRGNYTTNATMMYGRTAKFRVRVAAISGSGGIGPFSAHTYFNYSPTVINPTTTPRDLPDTEYGLPADPHPVQIPTVIYPSNGAAISQTNSRSVIVRWTPVTLAERYEVALECNGCWQSGWHKVSSNYTLTSERDRSDQSGLLSQSVSLAQNKQYRVRVRADKGRYGQVDADFKPWSGYSYFTFSAIDTPTITAPTANQVLTNFPRLVSVRWNTIDAMTGYVVEVDCYSCAYQNRWATLAAYNTARENFSLFENIILPGDNQYRARVSAITVNGVRGPWSDHVYFSFQTSASSSIVPFGMPVELRNTVDNGAQAANLSWKRDSAVGMYQLQIDCNGCAANTGWASYLDNAIIDPAASWYTSSEAGRSEVRAGIPENKQYRFRVRALAGGNRAESAWSDYTYFTFDKPTTTNLVAPVITSATVDGNGLHVTWNPVPGALQYTVAIYCPAGSTPCQERTVGVMTNRLDDRYTLPGKSYNIFVRAEDSALRWGPSSATWMVTL